MDTTNTFLSNISAIYILFFLLVLVVVAFIYFYQKTQKDFWKISYVDSMTGLPTWSKAKVESQKILDTNHHLQYIGITIDINKFTAVLSNLGIEESEKLINALAKILKKFINPKTDIITRVRASVFLVLKAVPVDYENEIFLRKQKKYYDFIQNNLFKRTGHKLYFTIAYYFLSQEDKDVLTVYEKLNYALMLAKNNYAISPFFHYGEELQEKVLLQHRIESKMENALANHEFIIYLQPKLSLESEKIIGAEALVRWHEQGVNKQAIYPDQFIPLFEDNGFIEKLDIYMFERACETIRFWIDNDIQPIPISVNFSRVHFYNPNFVTNLAEIAEKHSVSTQYLEVELTESTAFENEDVLMDLPFKLQQAGFSLSMDDFGTGYSSLGLLKNLPIDTIKLDKSFFEETSHKARAKAVVTSVVKLAKKLNINTVAEGVETKEHVDFLYDIGCEYVQGYYYARPMTVEELTLQSERFELHVKAPHPISFTYSTIENYALKSDSEQYLPIEAHKLISYSLRESLMQTYGTDEMLELFEKAGGFAGRAFKREFFTNITSFDQCMEIFLEHIARLKLLQVTYEKISEEDIKIKVVSNLNYEDSFHPTINAYYEGFFTTLFSNVMKRKNIVVSVELPNTEVFSLIFATR